MKKVLNEVKRLQKIAGILKENTITEAARVGSSPWSNILDDLKDYGWDIEENSAIKDLDLGGIGDLEDESEGLKISKVKISKQDPEDDYNNTIEWISYDEEGNELNQGSFDANGQSAGELDYNILDYIAE